MEKETKEVQIVEDDIVPKFEISIETAKSRLDELNTFIQSQMIEKIDYGTVPGINKPTLFKSGAEKLENIYGFYHEFEQLDKIEDFEKGFFFYRYKCKVFHKKTGIKQSECIGSANSKEKARIGQDPYNIINTIDKMAQKRSFVGAILSASRVSARFTQDVEDMKIKAKYLCSDCKKEITEKVSKYSTDKIGKSLCMSCQSKDTVVM